MAKLGLLYRYKNRRYILGFTVTVMLLVLFLAQNYRLVEKELQFVVTVPNREFGVNDVKHILFWRTPADETMSSIRGEENCIKQCPVRCVVTDDKNTISESDAFSFELTSLWPDNWNIGTRETIKFPTYRRLDQVWVVMNKEPPVHMFGDIKVFNGLFNWTMWYRPDSTVVTPYGSAHILNKTEAIKAAKEFKNRNFHKEKHLEIAGRVSNCNDAGRRYKTVNDLQKYVNIDMFGKCYNKTCGDPLEHNSCDRLVGMYKFYLAFENSNCKDYVTEKYWSALERSQIPIVNWNHVDSSLVIPNSYINIHDFKDIKSLAEYINIVSENETLYNSYFEWKKQYTISNECRSCILCRALHDPKRSAQVISNLDAWVRNDTCEKVGVFNNWVKNARGELFWRFGI